MATVRPALKYAILRELDTTSFGRDLFELEFQQEDYLLHLSYIPKKQFSFTIKEFKSTKGARYKFITIEAPGQWMLEHEEYQHETFGNARNRIIAWIKRIAW